MYQLSTVLGSLVSLLAGTIEFLYKEALHTSYIVAMRLIAYGKLCRNFSVERRHTGRKYMLPKKLSKRILMQVGRTGDYTIHENIAQGVKLVTQTH